MPVMIGDVKLYTTQELEGILEVSDSTIRKHLRRGTLQGRKMGRHWYVPEENLLDYFRNRGIVIQLPDLPIEEMPEENLIFLEPEPPPKPKPSPPPPKPEPVKMAKPALPQPPPPIPKPPPPDPVEFEDWRSEFESWEEEVAYLKRRAIRLKNEAHRVEKTYTEPEDEE